MSEMSSFYGGRTGASFVIVKRFDGIDIPQPGDGSGATEYTYARGVYAIDETGSFILTDDTSIGNIKVNNGTSVKYLIAKTTDNYKQYDWKGQDQDGSEINDTTFTFPKKLAEGMVQCFSQGSKTSTTVNYGEYVIIDTLENRWEINNPDNGKVYRRGMDLDTELAGAEYIGQIQGPQGESPELDFTTYNLVRQEATHQIDSYTPDNDSIVPGSYVEDGERKYEDEIKYAWSTIRDAWGNVKGCLVGFKLPTLVQEFEARSITPYTNRVKGDDGKYYNENLIVEDEEQFIDGKWQHPFYQKWQIKVPHGYHGINSTNIEIVPTKTKAAYSVAGIEEFAGAQLYSDPELTQAVEVATAALDVLRDDKYNADDSVAYAIVEKDGTEYYVKKEDCSSYIVRYRETNYDEVEEGDVTYYEIGDYNTIDKITLSENGILTVFNKSKAPEDLKYAVRWIDTETTDGITISDEGTVRVTYNTLDDAGEHEYQEYENVLDWIESVTLSQEGEFKVLFNNNSVTEDIDEKTGHSQYKTTLQWVDLVQVTDNGIINFYYNTDHTNPMYSTTGNNRLKTVKNITFDAGDDGVSGTQKFTVTYNTTDPATGKNEVEDNSDWAAMNFIFESRISTPTTEYPNAPYSHLLVIYSDPEYRKKFKDSWVSYPSEKLGMQFDQWVDMGNIRGEKGGLHTICTITDSALLHDDTDAETPIPPEYMIYAQNVRANGEKYTFVEDENKDTTYAGWGVSLKMADSNQNTIYFYDYVTKSWSIVGTITGGTLPENVVAKSVPKDGTMIPESRDDTLTENGFWFAVSQMVNLE